VILAFLLHKNYPAAVLLALDALRAGSPLEGTPIATNGDFANAISTLLEGDSRRVWPLFHEVSIA
jgi:hypothetical protein